MPVNPKTSKSVAPALQAEIDHLRELIGDASVLDALVRHGVGTVVKKVRGDRAKYGERALKQLEDAFDFDENTLRRFEAVAETWTKADLKKLLHRKNVKGLPLTWSHLELLAQVSSGARRDKFIEKILHDALSVRELRVLIHPPPAAKNEAMGGPLCGAAPIRQLTSHVLEVTRDVRRLDEFLGGEAAASPDYRDTLASAAKAYTELRAACDAAIQKLESSLAETSPAEAEPGSA